MGFKENLLNKIDDDVALRKSPSVKELISIRNARKILSDGDVMVSKRTDSVRIVKKMLIDGLDLTYTNADIAGIADDGAVSLESKDVDGVMQCLTLFSEMLGFQKAPKLFQSSHCEIRGNLEKGSGVEIQFGPVFMYDLKHDSLKFIRSTRFSPVRYRLMRRASTYSGGSNSS